jgi:hypothetical protein
VRPGLSPPCVPRSEDVRAGGLTPTVCRLVKDLTGDIEAVHKAISTARRMTAHQRVWVLAASTPLLRASRRRASYSVGFTLPDHMPQIYRTIPQRAWSPAYNTDGQPKDGADVTEITDLLDLAAWPPGMRAIMRRERPHLGAPLRFEDVDGYRLTAFATNTGIGQLPDLEVRHRLRARCSDRIRCATSTELGALPFPGFAANRAWCPITTLARDTLAWADMLALAGTRARRWEPGTQRHRLMAIPAAITTHHARRTIIRYKASHPWTETFISGLTRPQSLPAPSQQARTPIDQSNHPTKHKARHRPAHRLLSRMELGASESGEPSPCYPPRPPHAPAEASPLPSSS